MQYVKAGKQSVITRLLQQLSELSTAPARTYPLPLEGLIDRSSLMSIPSPSAFPRISSTRAWWTSKAIG